MSQQELNYQEKNVNQISEMNVRERRVHDGRIDQLQELLTHISVLHLSTSKESKAKAFLQLVEEMTGKKLTLGSDSEARLYVDGTPEPTGLTAVEVATHKALLPQRGDTEGAYGADVNAFVEQNGVMQPSHKLERQYTQMPEKELFQLYADMKQQYCFPENGQVRIIWDVASQFINGKSLAVSDAIEVISEPLDPELFDHFFFEAVENGLILSSNLHFGAIEALIENDQVTSVAILPKELVDMGVSLRAMRQLPDQTLMQAVLGSVVNNTQPYLS